MVNTLSGSTGVEMKSFFSTEEESILFTYFILVILVGGMEVIPTTTKTGGILYLFLFHSRCFGLVKDCPVPTLNAQHTVV